MEEKQRKKGKGNEKIAREEEKKHKALETEAKS